jgi:hypothetical protein
MNRGEEVDPWGDGRLAEAREYEHSVVLGLPQSGLESDSVIRVAVREAFLSGWAARERKPEATKGRSTE